MAQLFIRSGLVIKIAQSVKLRKVVHPRSRHSSRDWRQTTKAIRLKAEEGSSGIEAREGGNF